MPELAPEASVTETLKLAKWLWLAVVDEDDGAFFQLRLGEAGGGDFWFVGTNDIAVFHIGDREFQIFCVVIGINGGEVIGRQAHGLAFG